MLLIDYLLLVPIDSICNVYYQRFVILCAIAFKLGKVIHGFIKNDCDNLLGGFQFNIYNKVDRLLAPGGR